MNATKAEAAKQKEIKTSFANKVKTEKAGLNIMSENLTEDQKKYVPKVRPAHFDPKEATRRVVEFDRMQ